MLGEDPQIVRMRDHRSTPDSFRRSSSPDSEPEAETRWSLQQGNGLGFRFVDDEGQETVVAGNAVASARTPSSEGCKDREGE